MPFSATSIAPPMSMAIDMTIDMPPYRLSGAVYGTLLNHHSALKALGGTVAQPPYKGAPKAPVLYIKPRNTLAVDGDAVSIPPGVAELEVGASLGVVIGRTACHVAAEHALDHVAGYVIVNDISVPHPDYYRPSVCYKARDGFCPLGTVVARDAIQNPDALTIRIYIDDALVQTASTTDLLRPVAQLLTDVTEFMTLAPGDVLMVGVAAPAPRVRAGQRVTIEIDGVGALHNHFVGAMQ